MSPAPCGALDASGSTVTSPISRIQPSPPVKTTMTAAMAAARRADRPRKSRRARENTSRARAAARSRRLDDHRGDREDAGRLGQDRGMEVREPVIDERDAGEVGHVRREVAPRVQGLRDRQVDAEIAPVRATRADAVGRHAPDPDPEGHRHHRGRQEPHGQRGGRLTQRPDGGSADAAQQCDRDRERKEPDDAEHHAAAVPPGEVAQPVDQVRRDGDGQDDREPEATGGVDPRLEARDHEPARDEHEDRPHHDDGHRWHEPGERQRRRERHAGKEGAAGRLAHRLRIIRRGP